MIDTGTNQVSSINPGGSTPIGVAVGPDGGTAYITNTGSATMSVIDTNSTNIVNAVPVGSSPQGVAVSPDGTTAYVANTGSDTVPVILV